MRFIPIFSEKNINKIKKFYRIPSITAINRRKRVKKTIQNINRDASNVLDIGAGYEDWSYLFNDDVRYDTVDLRRDSHATYVGDFFDIDFPIKYDLIIATELLEHLPAPAALFNRANTLLQDNGRLLISFPFFFKIHGDPDDYYRYTLQGIKELSKGYFEIESSYHHGNKVQVIWETFVDGKLLLPLKLLNYLFAKIDYKDKFFPLGFVIVLKKVDIK